MADSGQDALALQVFHHVVLPRNLPGGEDRNLHQVEAEILRRLNDAVKQLALHAPTDDHASLGKIRLALSTCSALNVEGTIEKNMLLKELQQLEGGQALILHVTEQNAALLIYKQRSHSGTEVVIFEAFETSATCQQVLATEDAMQWDFPGQAVAVPYTTFVEEDFQQTLAEFLEQASLESIQQFAAIAHKARAPLPEIRDSSDPTLITGALMTILEVNGSLQSAPLLRKRVRDTVSFHKAHKPWRRSAFYLVLRVCMQRHLYTLLGVDRGRLYYKTMLSLFMSDLLADGLHIIPNAASDCLRRKLGRRLSKLELDQAQGSIAVQGLHRHIFRTLQPVIEKSLLTTTNVMQLNWEAFQKKTLRVIRPIQRYANLSELKLRLPNSGPMLSRAMLFRSSTAFSTVGPAAELLGHYEAAIPKPFVTVINRYLPLCDYEEGIARVVELDDYQKETASCVRLACKIKEYVSTVGNAYVDYPELQSRQILSLMELWKTMDECAVTCFPLLGEYHPGFDAAMFDVLELTTLSDLRRLQIVQSYISQRCRSWHGRGSKTIFDAPAKDSYAVRAYDTSTDAPRFQQLHRNIEQHATTLVAAKQKEWEIKTKDHETKIQQMAGLACPFATETDSNGRTTQVHQKGCRKHKLKWQAKQIEIGIFEYPLPRHEPTLKAVIFELLSPEAFVSYRDATWLILSAFAHSAEVAVDEVPLLREYSGLRSYANSAKPGVTLGSSTKSHLSTHYAKSGFPIPLRDVSRSFGMNLKYFDTTGKTWTSRTGHPSLVHLFPLKVPQNSPYRSFENIGADWPTSNKVVASLTQCPPDVTTQEYIAWQGILIGTHLRWPNLLLELGSTNLNFSSESTWAVVTKLCQQAGPASSKDTLRDVHSVFNDNNFCIKLLQQVDYRLETIRRNWREPIQFDTLLTVLFKVKALSSRARIQTMAGDMLAKARLIAQGWYRNLEMANEQAESGPSVFAIWAAVLCKRTTYPTFETSNDIPLQALRDFIVASIALQDCLIGSFDVLPFNLRNALLRDLALVHSFRHKLQSTLQKNSWPLLDALEALWPVPDGCVLSAARLHVASGSYWATMTLVGANTVQFCIHYNLLYGTLLIDGQPLGMLPTEYQKWPIIQELFGPQSLKTYPSGLPGMSLVVSRPMPFGHWVHLGFRDNHLVIRAQHRGVVLEHIERSCFGNEHQYDLPAPLGQNCHHWLNLDTGILMIRQQDPWKSKRSDWQIDLRTQQAIRNGGSRLVDPGSALATRITQNFRHFEHPYNITIFQPQKGPLRVELKRLELDFEVSKTGSLLCPQLSATIASSEAQDVGTWYGLKSKLVMQSAEDASRRSILLPIGPVLCERDDLHVSIVVQNKGGYLKFGVNNMLGRIECPAEPLLLYHRAMFHALTAYFLPDSLTGRTGVEEVMQYLQSGAYRPWTPLNSAAQSLLLEIAKLSPPRRYYPTALKNMEFVEWDVTKTVYIQDDRYRRVVNEILSRNAELLKFSVSNDVSGLLSIVDGNQHLENRALSRNYTYLSRKDRTYTSRDRRLLGQERANVAAIAKVLFEWPARIDNTKQLGKLLERFPVIGGYVRSFDAVQITDVLEADLGVEWGALVKTAQNCSYNDRFRLTFLFSLLSYSTKANMDLLRAIISFSLIPVLKVFPLPKVAAFSRFRLQDHPTVDTLSTAMQDAKKSYIAGPRMKQSVVSRHQSNHNVKAEEACTILAASILSQWPWKVLDTDRLATVDPALFDRDEALILVLPIWDRLVDNFEFSQHIEEVQTTLALHAREEQATASSQIHSNTQDHSVYPPRIHGGEMPSMRDLLEKDVSAHASTTTSHNRNFSVPASIIKFSDGVRQLFGANQIPKHIRELEQLVAPYRNSASAVQKRYGAELEDSIKVLSKQLTQPVVRQPAFNPTQLRSDLKAAENSLRMIFEQMCNALKKDDPRAKWLNMVGLWPKVTIVTLLTELRTTGGIKLGVGVQDLLIQLGLAITKYQRLLRIQDASLNNRTQQISDEMENIGHSNWSPSDHVDWLLLEIEGNVMLRAEQVDVALATISPDSGQNSVLQLLMGKGKTSCILPMVALELASKNLFRIVVPRPLLLQSAQIMQAKLGGLLNRDVLHVPFSRRNSTAEDLMHTYGQLHRDVAKQGGLILALPEHILSFRLSGIQQLCDGKLEEAALMIKTQAEFDKYARDVLDECDVTLGIRTQLIYPSGSQQTVDGHPHRWQTVQAVLDLLFSYLDNLSHKFPNSIEVVGRTGVPLMYFLREDVENYLTDQMVQKISRGQTDILPVRHFSEKSQQDIRAFLTIFLVEAEVTNRVYAMFAEKRHLVDVVLHLRGLFVYRILMSTLKKRWNVQYGLNPARDPIAVPYQAKGVPSPTAEWGHPDVAIILTCSSFYYEGLDMTQFKRAFNQLAKSNEPSIEYGLWVADGVPPAFKNYNAINVEDEEQLRELHQHVKYKVCLLDSYLNSFVFPQHAKQFSKKLSASSSDLVLYDPMLPGKARTTGFSGTNDTRHQLPMTIMQNDLPQLAHTNAEVLAYLLEERNRGYVRMVDEKTRKRLSEEELLGKLLHPNGYQGDKRDRIRILIDAGAQILEHDNHSLAKAWLKVDYEAAAAVYFDETHRAMVVYGKGASIPLVASPFAENLDNCLVYLDESHCRGTDLKLPPRAKAAVTLGPHLTKDALVQAAMRLRLLGTTQSVTFFSPPEVHQGILDLRSAAKRSSIPDLNSVDVIRWLLQQTCNAIDQLEPLYFSQMIEYLQRTQGQIDQPDFLVNRKSRKAYLNIVRTQEMQSLRELYAPKYEHHSTVINPSDFAPSLRPYITEVLQRRKGFQDRGFYVHHSTLEEVEQEREMEIELECVREVQLPVHFEALEINRLHDDIKHFATTGKIPAGSDAFTPMLCVLQKTALGLKHGTITAANIPARLYVSTQFTRTVQVSEPNDNFLRPCHWVLWSRIAENGLLVSPEEASLLIPILRDRSRFDIPTCHLIVYAAPITRHMLQFNSLEYYAIPRLPPTFKAPTWLKVELGIFAGRLYFEWDEYETIMSYLGMQMSQKDRGEYVPSGGWDAFSSKPLAFLHDWLAIRRKGLDFEHTPMGFITTGKPLSAEHPFFSAPKKEENDGTEFRSSGRVRKVVQDEEDDSDDDEDRAKEHFFRRDQSDDDDEEAESAQAGKKKGDDVSGLLY
ncbi:hypothetical protein CC86DRAFT_92549 [Ophiobolus disseminans]|uniref:ubiquitinyl hydrolase 1 n=1 Tax=Ophiobolus disseminans TaxID=1469910 RepID=A0A6A7AIX4_9PLEO|nr:hypothetical protein CC86DRAFT_92549 [Ophiobolus disseminans]